jgi:hypothetical protein
LDTENAEKTEKHPDSARAGGEICIFKALSVNFREFRVFRVRVSPWPAVWAGGKS